jgi:hypothetical protein
MAKSDRAEDYKRGSAGSRNADVIQYKTLLIPFAGQSFEGRSQPFYDAGYKPTIANQASDI